MRVWDALGHGTPALWAGFGAVHSYILAPGDSLSSRARWGSWLPFTVRAHIVGVPCCPVASFPLVSVPVEVSLVHPPQQATSLARFPDWECLGWLTRAVLSGYG